MSDKIIIEGTVEKVFDTETFSSRFSKRVLVINTGGEYPQLIPVEFVNDKTALLDNLIKGQIVVVGINIRGNEYKGKYYCNLQGWRIEVGAKPEQRDEPTLSDDEDSIPF